MVLTLSNAVDQVSTSVAEHGIDIADSEIKRQIEGELELFDISVERAANIVEEAIIETDRHGPRNETSFDPDAQSHEDDSRDNSLTLGQESTLGGGTQPIDTLTVRGQTATVEGAVVSLWEPDAHDIHQRGVIGDESGYLIFTTWQDGNHQDLAVGSSYRLRNGLTDRQGKETVLNVTDRSSIDELDTSKSTPETALVEALGASGTVVKIEDGSGVVERCPEDSCSRTLSAGCCTVHGPVDSGQTDIRIKALIDNGDSVGRLVFNRSQTEALTGKSLSDHSDEFSESVIPAAEQALLGTHVTALGIPLDQTLIVGQFDQTSVNSEYSPSQSKNLPKQ